MTPAASSPYSRVAITLHWLIALLIIGNLAAGFFLDGLFNSADPAQRKLGFEMVQLHKSSGLTILVLGLVRLGLRLGAGFPPLPHHMTPTERVLARGTHWGFYGLMVAIPIAGWVMVSASPLGFPTAWFGLFTWPNLPVGMSRQLSEAAGTVHGYLAIGATVLLGLHVAGALKHHFLDRDATLARMLPVLRPRP